MAPPPGSPPHLPHTSLETSGYFPLSTKFLEGLKPTQCSTHCHKCLLSDHDRLPGLSLLLVFTHLDTCPYLPLTASPSPAPPARPERSPTQTRLCASPAHLPRKYQVPLPGLSPHSHLQPCTHCSLFQPHLPAAPASGSILNPALSPPRRSHALQQSCPSPRCAVLLSLGDSAPTSSLPPGSLPGVPKEARRTEWWEGRRCFEPGWKSRILVLTDCVTSGR